MIASGRRWVPGGRRWPGRNWPGLLLGCCLLLAAAGCGSAAAQATPAGQPPVVPGQATQGPDLSGVQLPDFVMPIIKGGVSMPSRSLTPGAVTTTSADQVCNMAPHSAVPSLSTEVQTQAYDEYGHTTANSQHKYILDWLVPYNLGGAPVLANIWPASVPGTGFFQKVQTDEILRQMVCRRELTLAQAQQALEANWYTAWLRYVVSTGHI
jgi:hypothetical protein